MTAKLTVLGVELVEHKVPHEKLILRGSRRSLSILLRDSPDGGFCAFASVKGITSAGAVDAQLAYAFGETRESCAADLETLLVEIRDSLGGAACRS